MKPDVLAQKLESDVKRLLAEKHSNEGPISVRTKDFSENHPQSWPCVGVYIERGDVVSNLAVGIDEADELAASGTWDDIVSLRLEEAIEDMNFVAANGE